MYTFEYRFYPKQFDSEFLDEYYFYIVDFMSSLVLNGLILKDWQSTIKHDNYLTCRLTAFEQDSLEKNYYNRYNHQYFAALKEKSLKQPEYELIGANFDDEECCRCKNTSHFVLHGENYMNSSPVYCGDCFCPVPLYRFPKTHDESEYFDIISWQRAYCACDTQFMVGIGERHGYFMMHSPKSKLTQEGLRIAHFLEEKTGNPFYYYLYNFHSGNSIVCPICGKDWVNAESDLYHYDFVCKECRVIANKAAL